MPRKLELWLTAETAKVSFLDRLTSHTHRPSTLRLSEVEKCSKALPKISASWAEFFGASVSAHASRRTPCFYLDNLNVRWEGVCVWHDEEVEGLVTAVMVSRWE